MKKLFVAVSIVLAISSCTIAHTITVTNNAVGGKKGVAKAHNFSKDFDISIEKATKNGGITKVGTVEYKITQILFFMKYQTIITGE